MSQAIYRKISISVEEVSSGLPHSVLADSQSLLCTIAGCSGQAAVQGPEACSADGSSLVQTSPHWKLWQNRG